MEDPKRFISDQDLWEIVNNLHDEIMVYDNDYNCIFVNNASVRHYGKPPEELIGKKFSELSETYWGNSTLPEVYATKKTVTKRQITNLGKDIITISVPVFDEKGKIRFVVQNVNDIYTYNEAGNSEKNFLEVIRKNGTPEDQPVWDSLSMNRVFDTMRIIKDVKAPCLILGETGTGKSMIAKEMHDMGERSQKPFVVVNCACINASLFESELFGYRKGAFSGASSSGKKGIVEMADGGTLFLDEISEVPYDLQGKLLEFIQNQEFIPLGSEKKRKVDVKIIAATNKNLKQMVATKTFREDLYYRLNTFELTIPPLRDRLEDVRVLTLHYLEKYNKLYSLDHTISSDALRVLERYSWPGNVRELMHVIEKVTVLTKRKEIQASDLPNSIFDITAVDRGDPAFSGKTLDEAMDNLEETMLRDTYSKYPTSTKTAKALGISQPKAYRLLKKHNIIHDNKGNGR